MEWRWNCAWRLLAPWSSLLKIFTPRTIAALPARPGIQLETPKKRLQKDLHRFTIFIRYFSRLVGLTFYLFGVWCIIYIYIHILVTSSNNTPAKYQACLSPYETGMGWCWLCRLCWRPPFMPPVQLYEQEGCQRRERPVEAIHLSTQDNSRNCISPDLGL